MRFCLPWEFCKFWQGKDTVCSILISIVYRINVVHYCWLAWIMLVLYWTTWAGRYHCKGPHGSFVLFIVVLLFVRAALCIQYRDQSWWRWFLSDGCSCFMVACAPISFLAFTTSCTQSPHLWPIDPSTAMVPPSSTALRGVRIHGEFDSMCRILLLSCKSNTPWYLSVCTWTTETLSFQTPHIMPPQHVMSVCEMVLATKVNFVIASSWSHSLM